MLSNGRRTKDNGHPVERYRSIGVITFGSLSLCGKYRSVAVMKRRKNVKEFTQIGNVISNVLQSYRHEADEGLAQIWNLWDRAVGENIAKNTRPEAFKGKLLLVNVTSSAWAHELQFLKSDIIAKVNEVLGKALVEEIKFKVGPV